MFAEKDRANVLLRDLTLLDCQRYLTALRSSMNQTSLHHYATGLYVFFRWCVEGELLPKSPMQSIKTICPYMLPKAPPPEHVEQLLRACGSDWHGVRNRALISVLVDSGLRRAEALRLRIQDGNFVDRTLFVQQAKGQQDKTGHFGAETATALRRWLNLRVECVSRKLPLRQQRQ